MESNRQILEKDTGIFRQTAVQFRYFALFARFRPEGSEKSIDFEPVA
jgi:hypothetical protein